MAKSAVQYKISSLAAHGAIEARVIDIRTRRPWRPPEQQPANWPFLCDLALIFTVVLLGAWLFLKMRGG